MHEDSCITLDIIVNSLERDWFPDYIGYTGEVYERDER